MRSDNGNASRAACARGFMALFTVLAIGLGMMAKPAEAAPFAYVTNCESNNVSVIDTATTPPSVVATVPVGTCPTQFAVTPDGKHVYVLGDKNVSVIDTATNTVVATIAALPVGSAAGGVAFTPDGTHLYVLNETLSTVSVIDTATNTVVATVPVGTYPGGVAVTPDGKHVYVTNFSSNSVSVIATATNMVVATVGVGVDPQVVGIVPPPPGVSFLAFNANLDIAFGTAPNQDAFTLATSFTLSSTAPVIKPLTDTVTLQAGTFAVTIPPGSFKEFRKGGVQLRGSDQRRDPEGADQVHGHPALRFPGRSAGREFYRNHEHRVCHPGHWRRQRRNLGHGPDYFINPCFLA